MTILERRGLFWWHNESVPENLIAPRSSVPGLCRIEDNGRALLELDSYLPNPDGPMAYLLQAPGTACIQGLLKGSNERVLLSDLMRSGGEFRTNGISYERYIAMNCLVGTGPFLSCGDKPEFDILEIPLDGFEQWLGLRSINVKEKDGRIVATYEKPKDIFCEYNGGNISILFDAKTDRSGMIGTYAFSLKESAKIRIQFPNRIQINDLRLQHGILQDFFKLMTDSNYAMDWPSLLRSDGVYVRWYSARVNNSQNTTPPEYYNTVTRFSDIRDCFGEVWSRWNAMRDRTGAGFVLYFGTRRGIPMYIENHFINLIWGLEAFHRAKIGATITDKFTKKIDRIVNQIASTKDKTWLRGRLKNAHEPSLSQRLFEIFQMIPIGLDKNRLRTFSDSCATSRNELSHFGEQREPGSYKSSRHVLDIKIKALSILYHALILHEIGIDSAIIKRWIYDGANSLSIKFHFVEAGLLDQSVLPNGASFRPDAKRE
jgi:ApeA N-terminal domain 1